MTPEHFAQTVVEDYNLPASYHNVITKSIQDQLSDFRAHSGQYDGDGDIASPILVNLGLGGGGEDTLRKGILEGDEDRWWAEWRKRLLVIEESAAKGAKKGKGRKRKAVDDGAEGDVEDAGDGCDDDGWLMNWDKPEAVEEVDEQAMHEDMRILVKVFTFYFFTFREGSGLNRFVCA